MQQATSIKMIASNCNTLCRIGGVAALLAGALFRRNIAAEVGLFSAQAAPVMVSDWFALLQHNRLLGLVYLNIFDLVNYVLVGLMLLALYALLHQASQTSMAIALAVGFLGIAIYCASNTAFSMLALSHQYVTATTDTQRSLLLAAGEGLLALNRFSTPGAQPGSGGYLSLLLLAMTGMVISLVMLRSGVFYRVTAYVGLLASALDLTYCLAFVVLPTSNSAVVALYFIPAAGFFLMLWHILVGWQLYQLGKEHRRIDSKNNAFRLENL